MDRGAAAWAPLLWTRTMIITSSEFTPEDAARIPKRQRGRNTFRGARQLTRHLIKYGPPRPEDDESGERFSTDDDDDTTLNSFKERELKFKACARCGIVGHTASLCLPTCRCGEYTHYSDACPLRKLPTQALTPAPASLRGFGGEAVQVLGQALLLIAFGSGENRREEQVLFDVVDIPYNYNAILGRATLNQFEAISHHNYLKLKIPGPAGVIVVKGLQPSATSKGDLAIINRAVHNVEAELHSRPKHAPKPTPHSKIVKVQIDDADPAKLISLGDGMGEQEAEGILAVLKKNIDIFAWSPDEVGVVSTDLIMHQLAIKPDAKPRKQKLCKMSADRQEAAKAEVQKLLRAGVIQEIDHPEWLANPVLVRKSNGKWRMCVDFTDLNKACPKDDFPLPRIDQLVDSTAGYELMSFLDAYSSYHQIHMNPPDIPKTAFITLLGIFCHLRMPFGLRNAGATFARLVYKETFDNLRAAGIKLNPEKCVFGIRAGKLLGFLVSERGIEANPEKIDAIQQMKPPSSVHEVQKLAGRITALSRFLPKVAERGLPFFKTLRGMGKFSWTPECQAAFDELKQYLQSPPALISPTLGSELLLYLAASPVAVSAALVQETEFGQKPVYFVSEALQGAKARYIEMEKLAYALVMASRKLKHYFQAHKVIVPSQYPLGEILRGKEISGRLSKWAAELSPFDLHFVARTAVKSQVLTDFVAEWTPVFASEPEPVEQPWVMCSDGSWSHKGAGIAAILISPNRIPVWYAARLQFNTTNNAAEYEAILLGLRKAKALGVQRLLIRTDSKLVAGHVDRSFEAKEEGMKKIFRGCPNHGKVLHRHNC
uniref:Retrotransposon protein, putative, unclassified n=1 Tax=Oryza sativa subsp. japonica TaxID=39947 RepID=Q2QSS4_ORYSJ|nr:retrotransposon protein, putative, unclassified [Oryza sativa Japonica Group]